MVNQPQGDYRHVNVAKVSNRDIGDGEMQRILPRQLSTGSTRGTQTVGYGNTKIDGSNNRITIVNPNDNSSVGMGAIPGSTTGEYGFFSTDRSGKIIMKIVLGTWFVNDPGTDLNVMQSGILPDDSIGWAVAAEGKNVSDGFS